MAAYFASDCVGNSWISRPSVQGVVRTFAIGMPDWVDWWAVERVEPELLYVVEPFDDIVERAALTMSLTRGPRKELVPGGVSRANSIDRDRQHYSIPDSFRRWDRFPHQLPKFRVGESLDGLDLRFRGCGGIPDVLDRTRPRTGMVDSSLEELQALCDFELNVESGRKLLSNFFRPGLVVIRNRGDR